jgi:PilZ domain
MPSDQSEMTTDRVVIVRPTSSRRVAVRYKCGPATPGRVQLQGEEWQRAWILNLSLSGVGLLLGRQLAPGLEVVVHLTSGAGDKMFEIAARVRHATRQPDNEWVLGCEFAIPLTDEQMEALLQ